MKIKNTWIVILLAIIIAVILIWIFMPKPDPELQQHKQAIEKQIDSLKTKRSQVIDTVVSKSKSNTAKAAVIIKNLPKNETPVIRDTAYTAMCEYITNYKPGQP